MNLHLLSRLIAAVLIVITLLTVIQKSASSKDLPSGRVSGQVRNMDEQPISNAEVVLDLYPDNGYKRLSAQTDSNGFYSIAYDSMTGFENLSVIMRARALEYEYQARHVDLSDRDNEENFKLRVGGTVAGRVLLPNGSPAIHATVNIRGTQYQSTHTDKDGRFVIRHIYPITPLQLFAAYGNSRYTPLQPVLSEKERIDTGRYFAWRRPVELGDQNIEIRLQDESGIVGTVRDADTREPITRFKAILHHHFAADPQDRLTTLFPWVEREAEWTTPEPGAFGLSAPLPGLYVLTIQAEGYPATNKVINMEAPNIKKEVEVLLSKTGRGIATGTITPFHYESNLREVYLLSEEQHYPAYFWPNQKDQGIFQLDGIPPGAYGLHCDYYTKDNKVESKKLADVQVGDSKTDLGTFSVRSFYIEPAPWPEDPR